MFGSEAQPFLPIVDAVVIGRNEGARLDACLKSMKDQVRHVVYVDSGSTDGSVSRASEAGAQVVLLDSAIPFTAARARNAGIAALANRTQTADFVQFVDGDCQIDKDWIRSALDTFAGHPEIAVVCGRRRERFPDASLWNALCDREWNTPIGQATACGGDALMRLPTVLQVGGYREDLIAGEEPELCLRIGRAGGQIWRIKSEMTLHDAAMTKFKQWWRRTKRAGHAFAEGAAIHGHGPERHWVGETRRAVIWGGVLPILAAVLPFLHPAGLLFIILWPLQVLRLGWRWRSEGILGWQAAFFTVLGKVPEFLGVATYWINRVRRKREALIEYK